MKIIEEANRREISAPLFHAEFGGDIDVIRRRFKTMEKCGWLKQVGQETGGRRRSAVELFYRAAGPAIFKKESWAELPPSIKPVPIIWMTFAQLAETVKEAIVAGTFEARLGVVPSHVVHPVLLGGWRCRSPSNKEEPDESSR